MNKIIVFFIAFMCMLVTLEAVYVEVGTGTETINYIPAYGFYNYGWSRTVYLSGELLNPMDINTISYNVSNSPANYSLLSQSIYFKHTTETSLSTAAYIDPNTDDSYELVFTGDLTFNANGWYDIVLDTPFSYNGTDNLEVLVHNNDGYWASGYPSFMATTATPQRAAYNYSDSSFPATEGILSASYPNTRFYFTAENEPSIPVLATPSNNAFNVSSPIDLTWTIGDNTDWVKVYFSDDMTEVLSMAETTLAADEYTQQSLTVEDLDYSTTYYWKVVAGNNINELLVSSNIWSFTTAAEDVSNVIGNGTSTNTHLPMEPYYAYTISQTIYNQELINVDDSRIEQISYYYNGDSAWTEDNIQVYFGHTDVAEFADGDSWISIDNSVLVYDGPFTVPETEGWVTIMLTVPFNYNNEDNLLVSFESNTSVYHSSGAEFFGSTITGNKSIYYYSNTINSDFITPASGTATSFIPNIMLTMGDIPTSPQLMLTPEEYSWDDTIINASSNPVTFSMRNTGLGTLVINSVSIDQTTDFILVDNNTYPLEITDGIVQFSVTFNPLTVGDFAANITINDAEIGDTVVPLTGSVYDAMIYDFPHLEDFEGLVSGGLPAFWSSIIESDHVYSLVGVNSYGGYENTSCLRLYNSGALTPELYAITPPVDDLTTKRIRFMAKASTQGAQLVAGSAVNNIGEINFTVIDTLTLSSDWQQYVVSFDEADENCDFIALNYLGTGATYVTIFVDNFYIESIPTCPAMVITQDALNFGDVFLNRSGVSHLDVENWGVTPLEIEFSQPGSELSFTPETISIQPETVGTITVTLTPEAEGDYTGSFTVLSNDENNPSASLATTGFILPALPDNIAVIGTGTLTNQHMPVDPFYGYTYSQVIYYASEIGIADQRIEKISWHYNGNFAWGPDDFIIYMGHTSMSEFADNTDWIDASELMEVYNGTLTTTAEDGWIEFELDIPFVYDNTQNLVVAVEENTPGYHNSADEFYCTASEATRGISYYSDSINPDPLNPPDSSHLQNSFANITLEFGEIPDAPDLTVYPSNSIFEMVPVDGTSVEKTITMRSIALQDVTIAAAPTITGANADDFTITTDNNTYPLVLPFNATATIGVSLTPSSEGSKTANIEIVDDARETYIVTVAGYAYAEDGNDVPENATNLSLPVYGQTYAICPIGDVDWYKIPAMNTGDELFALVDNAGEENVSVFMWLYGPVTDANAIQQNLYIAYGSGFDYTIPAQGDYYLRISKSNIYPDASKVIHTRKNRNGESEKIARDDVCEYNLYLDAVSQEDYDSPCNLEAVIHDGYVELSWTEPPCERSLVGYKVYKDGQLITEDIIPIGTNTYQDYYVFYGYEYEYYVIAVYENPDGLSLPSNTETIFYNVFGTTLWSDNFDQHSDFDIDIPGWIQYDLDGADTYGIEGINFTNSGEAMSYIIFNPSATTPPITDMPAHGGDKYLASFASTTGANDDWIITPRIETVETTVVSFYAKSYNADYGLERFRVRTAISGSQVNDFQYSLHQGYDYLEAPTEWTPYYFNISDMSGSTLRFAIQCISNDAFIFMLDDFRVETNGMGNNDNQVVPILNRLTQNYPNPFNPETSIAYSTKDAGNVSIDIYNIKGQKVKTLVNEFKQAGNHNVVWNGRDDNNHQVASGVYLYKMRNGKFSSTRKMILMK